MNVNQLVNKLTRMVSSKLRNWGFNKAGHKVKTDASARQAPQQRARDKQARQAVKRARQAARITRRMK